MAKWITFQFLTQSESGKTGVWEVLNMHGDARNIVTLGSVKWFGRWRKYSFFPANDTVFEQDCLRDIADFCQAKTKEQRRDVDSSKRRS